MDYPKIPPKPEPVVVYAPTVDGQLMYAHARIDRIIERTNEELAKLTEKIARVSEHAAILVPAQLEAQLATRVEGIGTQLQESVTGMADVVNVALNRQDAAAEARFADAESYGSQQYAAVLDRLRLLEDESSCHRLVNRLAARVAELAEAVSVIPVGVEPAGSRPAPPAPYTNPYEGMSLVDLLDTSGESGPSRTSGPTALPDGYEVSSRGDETGGWFFWYCRARDVASEDFPSYSACVEAAQQDARNAAAPATATVTAPRDVQAPVLVLSQGIKASEPAVTAAVTSDTDILVEFILEATRLLARTLPALDTGTADLRREIRAWLKRAAVVAGPSR